MRCRGRLSLSKRGRILPRHGSVIMPPAQLSLAEPNRFDHNIDDARTPQNRDSQELIEVGYAQLLFEPVAIRLNGFQADL